MLKLYLKKLKKMTLIDTNKFLSHLLNVRHVSFSIDDKYQQTSSNNINDRFLLVSISNRY